MYKLNCISIIKWGRKLVRSYMNRCIDFIISVIKLVINKQIIIVKNSVNMYGNENATFYLPCLVCAEIQL